MSNDPLHNLREQQREILEAIAELRLELAIQRAANEPDETAIARLETYMTRGLGIVCRSQQLEAEYEE